MRDIFNIFKREKPKNLSHEMPEPIDNWKAERFEKNVSNGVAALESGREVHIFDDGRGYELALRIKQDYILSRMKQLAEQIYIEKGSSGIGIGFTKPDNKGYIDKLRRCKDY